MVLQIRCEQLEGFVRENYEAQKQLVLVQENITMISDIVDELSDNEIVMIKDVQMSPQGFSSIWARRLIRYGWYVGKWPSYACLILIEKPPCRCITRVMGILPLQTDQKMRGLVFMKNYCAAC